MKYKHYSPIGKVLVFKGKEEIVADEINKKARDSKEAKIKFLILASEQTLCHYEKEHTFVWGNKENPETFARNLYSALRYCDEIGAEQIFVEALSGNGIIDAVMNRLERAAEGNIITGGR